MLKRLTRKAQIMAPANQNFGIPRTPNLFLCVGPEAALN